MASTTSVEAGRRAAVGARVRTRRRGGLNGAAVRSYLGIAAIVVFCLAPFYWMVVTAFRDVGYTFDTTPWPTHVTMDNFRTAFSTSLGNHFGRALINSAIIGICTTVLAVMVGVFAAYALARLNFRGKYVILGVVLGAAPGQAFRRVLPPPPAQVLVTTATLAFIASGKAYLLATEWSSDRPRPV